VACVRGADAQCFGRLDALPSSSQTTEKARYYYPRFKVGASICLAS
jgi:hypothetical protein